MSNFSGDIIIDSKGNSTISSLGDIQLSTNDDDFLQKIFKSSPGSWYYYNTFGFDFSAYYGRFVSDSLINEIRQDLKDYLTKTFNLSVSIDLYSVEAGVLQITINILQSNFTNKEIGIELDLVNKNVEVTFENNNVPIKEQTIQVVNKYQKRA